MYKKALSLLVLTRQTMRKTKQIKTNCKKIHIPFAADNQKLNSDEIKKKNTFKLENDYKVILTQIVM